MTRSEVARALGRSIATVRRIEGVYLHPRRDANGIHRFDAREVRELQADLERRAVCLAPSWFENRGPHDDVEANAVGRENAALRKMLALTIRVARLVTANRRLTPDLKAILQDAEEIAVQ